MARWKAHVEFLLSVTERLFLSHTVKALQGKCVKTRCLPEGVGQFQPSFQVEGWYHSKGNWLRYNVAAECWQFYTTPCLKKVPRLACYNFNAREWIWIFFGRNITDKVGNQKTLYYAISNNLCFCTTWQNAETRKSHTSLNCIVLYTQCTCVLSSWKKKLSSAMCLIASNICWGSKISHYYCPLTFTPGLTKNNSHLLHSDWQRHRLG